MSRIGHKLSAGAAIVFGVVFGTAIADEAPFEFNIAAYGNSGHTVWSFNFKGTSDVTRITNIVANRGRCKWAFNVKPKFPITLKFAQVIDGVRNSINVEDCHPIETTISTDKGDFNFQDDRQDVHNNIGIIYNSYGNTLYLTNYGDEILRFNNIRVDRGNCKWNTSTFGSHLDRLGFGEEAQIITDCSPTEVTVETVFLNGSNLMVTTFAHIRSVFYR